MHTHRNHAWMCGAVIAVAVIAMVAGATPAANIGLLAMVLICPIVMGAGMWLLMRSGPAEPREDQPREVQR